MPLPAPPPFLVVAFVPLPPLVAGALPLMLHRAERALGRPPAVARRGTADREG